MRLVSIHRYPVKSLAGEALETVVMTPRGLEHDRGWAAVLRDGGLGSGKRTRRFRRVDVLFTLSARMPRSRSATDRPVPEVVFPDGRVVGADDEGVHAALSMHCGIPLRLCREGEPGPVTRDFMDSGRVSLVGTASLAEAARLLGESEPLDPKRFRANLVIETEQPFVEEGWVGRRIEIGEAMLVGDAPIPRCRMVDIAQADVPERRGVLAMLGAHRDVQLAFYADPGSDATVRVGDRVSVR